MTQRRYAAPDGLVHSADDAGTNIVRITRCERMPKHLVRWPSERLQPTEAQVTCLECLGSYSRRRP